MSDSINIMEEGPQSYRDLQQANNSGLEPASPEFIELSSTINLYSAPRNPFDYDTSELYVQTGLNKKNNFFDDYWGNSIFDEDSTNEYGITTLGDTRANNLPWIAKLGAGIAKGAVLAGTTFMDGTVGLFTGIASSIDRFTNNNKDYNGKKYSAARSAEALWLGEYSNTLLDINKMFEDLLPNYRTEEELNRSWYLNLGTVNFWADSFIKNLGFTVGAFLSGMALTSALKAMNLIKGSMGSAVAGSILSAINEGRIEANNNSDDWENLLLSQIDDLYLLLYNLIMSQNISYEEKLNLVNLLLTKTQELTNDIKEKKAKMGLTDLIGNTVLLSLGNFYAFGRLYAGGYARAKKLFTGKVTRENLLKGIKEKAAEEAAKNVSKTAGKYTWIGKTDKSAALKGAKIGLVEGNEELALAFLSDYSGNMLTPDSPDAYYRALTDPNAQILTKDFLSSVTEGFTNTYGNLDRYEEFAVGALTGLLGMPTFGKVANSGYDTYLGKGKMVGLSGGLFGEIRNNRRQNEEGEKTVEGMNRDVERILNQRNHFVLSLKFTNDMDGWVASDNKFEYKNSEDNDDFAMVSRFASVGKLQDLKDLIDLDFENKSEEELKEIARFTDPNTGEEDGSWRMPDGTYMSDSPEGIEIMRLQLIDKRDKIKKEIDAYEESIEAIRARGNNGLDESQVEELAWLRWKIHRFDDRFSLIKKDDESLLLKLIKGIKSFQENVLEDYKNNKEIDEETGEVIYDEEGYNSWTKRTNNLLKFIEYLADADNSLALALRINRNSELMNFLESEFSFDMFADELGMKYDEYKKVMSDLNDAGKIASAALTFNERLTDFMQDPMKLIKNREDIDKKAELNKDTLDTATKQEKVLNASVSDIVNSNDDDLDLEGLDDILNDEGTPKELIAKIKEAQNVVKTYNNLNRAIDGLSSEDGEESQAAKDAKKLLDNSKLVSQSAEELTDTSSLAFNDANILIDEDDPTIAEMMENNPQGLEEMMNARLDAAKSLMEQAKAIILLNDFDLNDFPKEGEGEVKRTVGSELVNKETLETGHDSSPKADPVNLPKTVVEDESEKIKLSVNSILDKYTYQSEEEKNIIAGNALIILATINSLVKAGNSTLEVISMISGLSSYNRLKSTRPDILAGIVLYSLNNDTSTELKKLSTNTTENIPIVNPSVSEVISNSDNVVNYNSGEIGATYLYWKPTTSLYPIHKAKGDNRPYYEIAKSLNKYSAQQLKRMEAVYKYLDAHNAFNNVDKGIIKAGSLVLFIIDKALNDAAGEIVILMTDKDGNVLGDIMSKNDSSFKSQVGLSEFVEKIEQQYEKEGKPDKFVATITTSVDKMMVGKVPYASNEEGMHTLNQIHSTSDSNGNQIKTPFRLGIAVTSGKNARILSSPGRTKKQGLNDLERSILPPLTAKAGQPFLLMPTGNTKNAYVSVPIIMKLYSKETENTSLGKAIEAILTRMTAMHQGEELGFVDELLELLSLPDSLDSEGNLRGIYISLDKSGNLTITINPIGLKSKNIYNGPLNNPNLVQIVKEGLYGLSFNISRKYMNSDYNGVDYNSMIGEIAETNLPIGATHTVNNWFTIKPVSYKGETIKTLSPKTLGVNPNASVPVNINYKGSEFLIDPKTYSVTQNGIEYKGKDVNNIKARAYGQMTKMSTKQVYNTPWGYYNPLQDLFVTAPASENKEDNNISNNNLQLTTTPKIIEINQTERDLDLDAKKKGLLNSPIKKDLWKLLTEEQKEIILNKKGPKQKQWMDYLENKYDPKNPSSIKTIAADLLGTAPFRKVNKQQFKVWNRDKEEKWLKKVLPNLSTEERYRVLEGLIRVAQNEDAGYAWGKFQDGVIIVANNAAEGTLYHEAFHAIVGTLLSDEEINSLFNAAKEAYGDLSNIELEENLAEDFRRYVTIEQIPVLGTIIKTFRLLKHLVQNLIGNEPYLNNLFFRINRGELANKTLRAKNNSAKLSETENYSKELKEILVNAKRDSEGNLLAPNGKKSNLNERLWIHVRTKAFKDWFGDWENDPINASKVVDENGEPLVVYHSVLINYNPNFHIFNMSIEGRNTMAYFTNNLEMSKSYTAKEGTIEGEKLYRYTPELVKELLNKNAGSLNSIDKAINRFNNNSNWKEYFNDLTLDESDFDNYLKTKELRIKELLKLKDNILENNKELKHKLSHPEEMEWIKEVFLNIRSPKNINANKRSWNLLDDSGLSKEELDKRIKYANDKEKYRLEVLETYIKDHYGESTYNDIYLYGEYSAEDVLNENDIANINNVVNKKYPENYTFDSTRSIQDKIINDKKYDGMIVENVYDYGSFTTSYKSSNVFAIKDPNQVKSATENIGTYSKESDDIRYRKTIDNLYNKDQFQIILLYHLEKLMYAKLSEEQLDYLEERNISLEEYENMTNIEKETLFKCM